MIIQTLRLAFLDYLLILFIFLAILMAFVVCTYFSFGTHYSEFNNLRFPLTEKIHNEVLSLPISPFLNEDEAIFVCEKITSFCK